MQLAPNLSLLYTVDRSGDDFQLTAIALIRSVSAFFAMVAFLKFGDAFFAVGTSEFRKVARRAFAPLLVLFIATIEVSIAALFAGHAQTVTALDIILLACTIVCKKERRKVYIF